MEPDFLGTKVYVKGPSYTWREIGAIALIALGCVGFFLVGFNKGRDVGVTLGNTEAALNRSVKCQ